MVRLSGLGSRRFDGRTFVGFQQMEFQSFDNIILTCLRELQNILEAILAVNFDSISVHVHCKSFCSSGSSLTFNKYSLLVSDKRTCSMSEGK